MAKTKTVYVCQSCGAQFSKWMGKCTSCGEWNTLSEELVAPQTGKSGKNGVSGKYLQTNTPRLLTDIEDHQESRLDLKNHELNRILGGGLVKGSVVLLGGEPGIGKSTLALQVALMLEQKKILYVSGEESLNQIKIRAQRLGKSNEHSYFLSETSLESIRNQIESLLPDLLIIDSIQTLRTETLESTPGSISQIRECANSLIEAAKQKHLPVILIGHITKEGSLAGPKVLEHMVDVVLQFEGDLNYLYRLLRPEKNRFGSTNELGIFEMQNNGLKEVLNPSELLLSHFDEDLSGTSVAATIDGIRPFLIEVQALVSTAVYGTPQRSATGFDTRRLNMLLAVLEKRAGFHLAAKDVFLNIAGGIRVQDPAIDLAVVSSVLSSNVDMPVSKNICFAGEVGLSGEIRPVTRIEQRISEAQKLGFEQIMVSKYNKKNLQHQHYNTEIVFISKIEEAFHYLFG